MGEVSCADAFAPKSGEGGEGEGGGGLSFPMKPMSLFAVAAYVYDCAGGATPSGANENGETTCQCPAGMVYVDGECVEATAENKCKAAGWEFKLTLGGQLKTCLTRSANALVTDNAATRFSSEFCSIDENGIVGEGTCYTDFGPDLNFPLRPADESLPHYAYNCGWAGGNVPANNGLIPRRYANGATNCYCEDSTATHFGATVIDNGGGVTLRYGGVCLSGESARAAAACEGAGWSLTSDSKGWQCAIPVMRGTLSAGSSEGCYLSGVATVALPQCSEVFGGSYAFPAKPTGTAPRYVFDCGTKMTPEGANLDGATICECAATNAQGQCICGGGRMENADGECVCGGDTAEVGGVCVNREGPIGGVSEGIAAQVTLCTAFGGETLGGEIVIPKAAQDVINLANNRAQTAASQNGRDAYSDTALAVRDWTLGKADYTVHFDPNLITEYSSVQRDLIVGGFGTPGFNCAGTGDDGLDDLICSIETLPRGEVSLPTVCRGVDKSGTFCLLGSLEVFPCRGLFTRARDCNIKYNRPLLNPFLCAPSCPPPSPPAAPLANNPYHRHPIVNPSSNHRHSGIFIPRARKSKHPKRMQPREMKISGIP